MRRNHLLLGLGMSMLIAGIALGLATAPTWGRKETHESAGLAELSTTAPQETIKLDAFLRGPNFTLEQLARATVGAGVVTVLEVVQQFALHDERRPATSEDVTQFAEAGKTIDEGQAIGSSGIPKTVFKVQIDWLDGGTEDAEIVQTGGVLDGVRVELEGAPLPEVGQRYLLFLDDGPDGRYVGQVVRFLVTDGDRLEALGFEAMPVPLQLDGLTIDEALPAIRDAYERAAVPLEIAE